MPESIAYSALLQDFIEPIRTPDDTEDSYFDKCLLGHVVWNYCICLEHRLDVTADVFKVLNEKYLSIPKTKKAVDLLQKRWFDLFRQYDRFIFRIESRDKNGSTTLYVETMSVEIMKQIQKQTNDLPVPYRIK